MKALIRLDDGVSVARVDACRDPALLAVPSFGLQAIVLNLDPDAGPFKAKPPKFTKRASQRTDLAACTQVASENKATQGNLASPWYAWSLALAPICDALSRQVSSRTLLRIFSFLSHTRTRSRESRT